MPAHGVLAAAREQLRYLAAHPDAPDHAERIEALVASPEPLIRLLGERIGGQAGHGPLLELLTRRYYKIVALEDVRSSRLDGRQLVTARYSLEGRWVQPDCDARRGRGVARGRRGCRCVGVRCPHLRSRRRLVPSLERAAARYRHDGRRTGRRAQRGAARPRRCGAWRWQWQWAVGLAPTCITSCSAPPRGAFTKSASPASCTR